MIDTDRPYWFNTVSDPEPLKLVSDPQRLALLDQRAPSVARREALNRAELNGLRELVDFQAHTVSHPILPACTTDKASREIHEAKEELESRHGFEVFALAYPNGDYTEREARLAERAGYECALTMDFGFNTAATDRFRLRRITVNDDEGVNVLAVRACGFWGIARNVIGWRKRNRLSDRRRGHVIGGVPERPKGLGI